MKNTIMLLIITAILPCAAFCYELKGLPDEYNYAFDMMSQRNDLFFIASELERRGIRVVIINDLSKTVKDLGYESKAWLEANKDGRETILIMLSKKQSRAQIEITDGLKAKLGENFAQSTAESILIPTLWRWYIPLNGSLAKALGAVIFALDGPETATKPSQLRLQVRPVGFWYKLSTVFPGREITSLFLLEPVSFMIYFPMLTFYVLVSIFGKANGIAAYRVMKWIWVFLMAVSAGVIWGRLNAVYPEFMLMFRIFFGATVPLYFYILLMYDRELYMAAYSYFDQITGGGFDEKNAFEGRPWNSTADNAYRLQRR